MNQVDHYCRCVHEKRGSILEGLRKSFFETAVRLAVKENLAWSDLVHEEAAKLVRFPSLNCRMKRLRSLKICLEIQFAVNYFEDSTGG